MFKDFLSCPKCKNVVLFDGEQVFCTNESCTHFTKPFLTISGKQVLVDFDESVLSEEYIMSSGASSLIPRISNFRVGTLFLRQLLNGRSRKTISNLEKLASFLDGIDEPKILVVGGGTIGSGMDYFFQNFKKNTVSFDIYNSDNVDFIADAHSIPFLSNYFDVIVIQAVLEHVVSPTVVVSECHRVLRDGGLIYAETPFMQQVHEGAYDFTRFTVLGHRLLFKDFRTVKLGYISGLGQSFLWSLEFFVSGLFRSKKVGKLFKLCFFWIRFFERFIPDEMNEDGACGCFFLGQKDLNMQSHKMSELLLEYRGLHRLN